jgi:hypothetical protein
VLRLKLSNIKIISLGQEIHEILNLDSV